MNKAQTETVRLERCLSVLEDSGTTVRRKIKGDAFFAFRLHSWITFVRECDNQEEQQKNSQLPLF